MSTKKTTNAQARPRRRREPRRRASQKRAPSVKTAARTADAASSAGPAATPCAPGLARKATPAASESLLALTTANFAALRKQLHAGGGKRTRATPAKDDDNLAEALKRLETGYRVLLRRS